MYDTEKELLKEKEPEKEKEKGKQKAVERWNPIMGDAGVRRLTEAGADAETRSEL